MAQLGTEPRLQTSLKQYFLDLQENLHGGVTTAVEILGGLSVRLTEAITLDGELLVETSHLHPPAHHFSQLLLLLFLGF